MSRSQIVRPEAGREAVLETTHIADTSLTGVEARLESDSKEPGADLEIESSTPALDTQ